MAGSTGEFPALDDAERLSLIELALDEAGPDRVIAHIGAPDARHSARLARAAVALGATRDRGDHAVLPARAPRRADRPLPPDPRRRGRRRALRLYFFRTDRPSRVPSPVRRGGVGRGPGRRQDQRILGGQPGRLHRGRAGPADLLRRRHEPRRHHAGRRGRRGLRPQRRLPGDLRGSRGRRSRGATPRRRRGCSGRWTGSSRSARASAGSSTRSRYAGSAAPRPG